MTKQKDYNLKSKKLSKSVKVKLLEQISSLSEDDKVIILNRPKD
ncbi:MAG: Hypothetical protein LKU_00647 [Lactobacillus kefiranofaciens]|nr:hypothetical protein WANG_0191 [Lactobacillus kefiranofaciens subsp. kefiranofaciens]